MHLTRRAVFGVVTALIFAGAVPVMTQDEISIVRGELLKVDTTSKTIVIKTDANLEMIFSYTDATKVTGMNVGIAGLATMKGLPVTIHFARQEQTNVAIYIDIQKKS